MNTTGIGQS